MSSSETQCAASRLSGLEAAAVFALIVLYIWWLRFRYPYSWIGILMLVVASHLSRREGLGKLGFQWTGTARAFEELSAPLAFVGLAILAAGFVLGTIRNVSWEGAFFGLAVYLAWGLFQQYLLNGYFVNRFAALMPHRAGGVSVAAATLFALAHAPNWFLMPITFAGGYVCARIYLKHRNLYFLGVAHGIIGFLIYLVAPDSVSHHLYVGPKWFSA